MAKWVTIKEHGNWPAVWFIMLNLLDLGLTVILIHLDIGYEGNPLLAGPLWKIMTLKLTLTFIIVMLLASRVTLIKVANVGLTLIVLFNLTWLLIWLFLA